MLYKCKHNKTGNEYIHNMLTNTEFIRRYGFMNPAMFEIYASSLINEWNNSVNNRDKDYFYSLVNSD